MSITIDMMVAELCIEVVRKRIKHCYIRVRRDDGRVRVSAPAGMSDAAVRRLINARLPWIRRQRQRLAAIEHATATRLVSGETHYLQGRPYRLRVVERPGRATCAVVDDDTVELRVARGTTSAKRRDVLAQWHRRHLREEIPRLVRLWEPEMGVAVAEWRIKRMRTRWGSCNIRDRRIWLNLGLAAKPPECLEYVIVHEMVHLLERRHSPRFYALMDRFLPDWRERRGRLTLE